MECHFFQLSGTTPDGDYVECSHTCYRYTALGRVCWELLPLLVAKNTQSGPLDVCKRVRSERQAWSLRWALCGWEESDILYPPQDGHLDAPAA